MRSKKLPLEKISLHGDTQPRAAIDDILVLEYSRDMKAGVEFPPIVVFFDGVVYWLVDGFHRWFATKKAGLDKIVCEVRQGTREEARWFSYSANKAHGLRRTNADKRKAVIAALKHPNGTKMSDRQIAEHVGVSAPTVGKHREELAATVKSLQSTERTGRDGRTINTSNIGAKPPGKTSKDVDIQPVAPERLCADCDGPEGQCGCPPVVEVDDPDPVEIPEDATAIPAPGDLSDDDMNMVAEMLRACCDALDELEHKPTAAVWIRFGEQFARYVTTQAAGAANDPTEEL